MKKLSIVCLAVVMAVVFGYGSAFAATANTAADQTNFAEVEVSFVSPGPVEEGTGKDKWYSIFDGVIHTANAKELIADVSFETGIATDTTVYSKQLTRALANAMAKVEVIVVMDPGYNSEGDKKVWDEVNGQLAIPGAVVFAMRDQTLVAKLAGQLPVTCVDGICNVATDFGEDDIQEEMIRLVLNTLTANSFNFILPNCPTGTHNIGVFAKFTYTNDTMPLTTEDPAIEEGVAQGFSKAYIGKGTVVIQEARMVKGEF